MGILLSEIKRKYGSGGNGDQEERALDRPIRRFAELIPDSAENAKDDYDGIGPDIVGNIPILGPLIRSAAVTATDTAGLGLQGLGAELNGLAELSDKSNNPNVNSSFYGTAGNLLSDLGSWLASTTQTPLYEKYRPSQKWQEQELSDIWRNGEMLEYITDPQGLRAELGGGLGSMAAFLALARLLPTAAPAQAIAGRGLQTTSNLLGKQGLNRMAQIAGSNAAKEFAGTGLHFAGTMAPAGALVNAATIIEPLKEQGLSDSDIAGRMNSLIAEELPADIAFAALTGNVLKGQLGRLIAPRNSSPFQKALANAAGIPIEGLGGYYSNVNQAILSEKYSGQPYGELFGEHTPYEETAGRMGALAGVPFAAYGGVRGYRDAQAREQFENEQLDAERLQEFNRRNRESKVRQATRDAIEDAFTAKQTEIWDAAQYASRRAKEKFGYDIQPELIYKQWAHESGTNFDSENARYNNNFGGLTQTEPNGEENKQPDGSNYYRHFNNVRDYADAYVDDFIKYYPEISGTKNEREFANVLKKHGYFGDTVDNYASGMEGIIVPSSQTKTWDILGVENYNMPTQSSRIDNQVASLKDGWQTVIPQIGGVLREKFGINAEISSAARSAEHNAEVGGVPTSYHIIRDNGGDALDIVFDRETSQEEQDAIADYFRNTGLFSEVLYHDVGSGAHLHLGGLKTENLGVQGRAEQLYNQRITEGVQRELKPKEPEKPLFDINAEDTITPKLIEQFLTNRFNTTSAAENPDVQEIQFISNMFDGNTFQDTPENRQAVLDRYGNELRQYFQGNSPSVQEQPTQPAVKSATNPAPQSNKPMTNQDIVRESRKFLDELKGEGRNNPAPAEVELGTRIQTLIQDRNFDELKRILQENSRLAEQTQAQPIQPSQPTQPSQQQQEQPVSKNKPPQNILPQPKLTAAYRENVSNAVINFLDKAITNGRNNTATPEQMKTVENLVTFTNKHGTDFSNHSDKEIAELAKILKQGGVELEEPQIDTSSYNKALFDAAQSLLPLKTRANQILQQAEQKRRESWDKAVADETANRDRNESEIQNNLDRIDDFKTQEQIRKIERRELDLEEFKRQQGIFNRTGTHKDYGALADDAHRRREAYLATIGDQNRIKQIDESERRENAEMHNRQEREESEETQKYSSPEQLRANYLAAQRLGDADTNARLDLLQQEGRKQRDQEREQQKAAEQDSRINSAKDILRLLRDPKYSEAKTKIENTSGLMTALQQGSKEAIRVARSIVAESNAPSEQEPQQPKPKSESTQQPQKAKQPEEIQPVKKESPQPKKPRSKVVYGNTTEVISDSRTPYKVKYKVVEADDLTTSHEIENGNVFRNNKYPAELQPRQRERSNMQAGLISMAGNLNPKDLMESRNGNQGAPVVRNDGVVLNGNGRVAAAHYAYKNGTTNGYKESLIQNAEKLGLNADDISKMNQPILVRELAEELTPEKINDLTTSQTGGARMGGAEQAKIDAKNLSSDTLARMSKIEDIDFTSDEATEVTRAALQDIVANQNELNDLVTDDGKISQDGVIRLKRALFAKAYGDNSVIARMSESTNDNVRNITNALLSAAPSIANVQEHIENGTLHKYDLSSIVSAVKKLSDLRERGTPVSNYLKEQSLFARHADSEETREILDTFDKNKRSAKKLANFLKNIATKIQHQGDPQEETLFGKNEKPPLINLIRQAREAAENDRNIPLFSKEGTDVDTTINNFVEDKDLTPQQKLLKSFGNKLGVKTVFFRNADGRFHGAHSGNTTYINVNSKMPLSKVFWHESLHWLKANNPELYKDLAKAAGITTAQRQAYLEKTGRTDIKAPDEINEEILADQMEDAAKRTGLLQSIAGKGRGLIQRVIQWLKDTMNKFVDHFRNPDGKLTTKQAQAFADEFGKIANQLKDPNGNKIFRYNRRTRNIELADGRQLEETPFNENELREKVAKGEREGTTKYSVGNNNNSSEALAKKLRSTFPSIFGTSQNRRRKAITDNLRRLNGYRILYGYIDGADDVVIDHLQKLIQSRNAYDWDKLLPVVGKEIAKNLKLNPTQAQSNYIADWLMTGALNNSSAEAQAFEKAMRDNPAMAETLIETQDIFKELASMDAWDSVKSTIAHRQNKTFWEKIKFFAKNFTEQTLDDLHPLQKIVDKAIKQAPPAVAEAIKRGVNVKQLAQLARGRGATADMMINGNKGEIDKIREELASQYAGCYFDDFKTLKMIIESVGGDWQGLEAFALAKLSKEMIEKNRNDGADYTPYMSVAKADFIIRSGEAKFGQAQKDLVRFSKILAAMQYDAGLLTDATFARFMKGWKEYIPTPRVFDENEDYNKLDFMKAKKGHTDDTWSPVQTVMANTHKIIQACERNKVKQEIASLVRFGGFDSNLSEVPTGNPDADNVIRFKENGKTKYLETPDPAIKRAIESMQDRSESNWLIKTLRATAGFIRAAYTMLNPDFAAGNILRDLPDAFIHNKQLGDTTSIAGMVQAWSALIKALPSAFSEARQAFWNGKFSNDFIEWQMNGGAQASFVSEDVDYIQRSINAATSGKRFYGVLDTFQKFSEFSENVTRLASYKVAKANLAKAGKTGVTGKQLAALAAREASIDFSKAGRATRTLNKGVVFANAAVQGINQWIEAFREGQKGNWKPMIGKALRAGVQGVFLALAQAALARFGDDDDKKAYEQAPDWEKETYWIFPSIGLRIPKGMDVGLRLWANLTDEFAGVMLDGNSFNGKRLLSTIWGALPSLTATAITPAVETLMNYSYFRGAPIDPKSEQHLPAHMRYDETTSWFAKQFGDMTGWSPRKIDYLINGYLGFMGRFATHIPNYSGRALRGEFPIDWDEAPIARRFVFTPYKNPKIVKEFYEAYDKQEQLHNEYKLTKERPDDYDAALHNRIKGAYEQIHKISKQEKLVLQDTKLSHDERKEKLRELEKRRVAIAERVFQRAR